MANVEWFGDQWLSKFEHDLNRKLKRAAIFLSGQVKKNISTGFPPASAPGDFPHVRTGALRSSIAWELDEHRHIARIGSSLVYARYLTKGTDYMKQREFLERTLKENKGVIARIIKGHPK